jgi:nitroreductase
MDSIFHRTSIRKYLQRDVEEGKITEILKAAMAAPSAGICTD